MQNPNPNYGKFPAMHIAESAYNRIMNMHAELLPLTNLALPQQQDRGVPEQRIGDLAGTPQDTSVAPAMPGIEGADPAVQGAALDEQLAMGGVAGGTAAPATAAGLPAAGDLAGIGAAGAAGGAAVGAGAAVAGEAVASGAELLPLLALA